MKIQESGEMYLETILKLKNEKHKLRAVDIIEELDYSKSSVSRAVNLLKDNGFITIDRDGYIELTEQGLLIATEIFERHSLLSEYFILLGVDKEVAEADACRIEHVISRQTFDAIKRNKDKLI